MGCPKEKEKVKMSEVKMTITQESQMWENYLKETVKWMNEQTGKNVTFAQWKLALFQQQVAQGGQSPAFTQAYELASTWPESKRGPKASG